MNKIRSLIKFDEKIKNVCSEDSPSDSKWREYQIQIDRLIDKSIRKNQIHLTQIEEKLHWLQLFKAGVSLFTLPVLEEKA
jgi:hypothetical protein